MQDKEIVLKIFIVTTVLVIALLGFILFALLLFRRKQQNFAIELEKIKTNFEKELLKTQLEIQEQTFQYISQEIHDNIGQIISLAKLQLNTLDSLDPALVKNKIGDSVEMLTRALDDLRDLSRSLSSEIIRSNGLASAIELQIAQLKKLGSLEVVYEVGGDYQFMDEQKEIFILRILQEAVNNIIRHSDAGRVDIHLSYMENNLSLSIADDGKGFDRCAIAGGNTSGISNMSKRAKMIGADFAIDSTIGAGAVVRLSVPY